MQMGPSKRLQFALFFGALAMTVLSIRPIYALEKSIIPTILAIAPVSGDKVSEVLVAHMRNIESESAVVSLVRAQADEVKRMHEGWLALGEAALTIAWIQLVAWASALALMGWQLMRQLRVTKDAA